MLHMLNYYKVNHRYLNNALYFLSKMPINRIASHEHMKILINLSGFLDPFLS